MTAALRRIETDSRQGNIPDRREPSPALRRKPSLYLTSRNPHRLTTTTYAGQGRPNAAGARRAGAADQQGRLTTWTLGTTTRTYTFDANSNLTGETGAQNRSFTYDPEDRLLAESGLHTQAYGYDLNGNRTQDLKTDLTPRTYTYTPSTNRLTALGAQAHTLDPTGNTLGDKNGKRAFTYDAAGRLTTVTVDGVLKGTYTYNHQHQRTRKVRATATGTSRFVYHYDLAGNLIAETRPNGTLVRAYVYDDQAPIAQFQRDGATQTYAMVHVHTDHLGTPRSATDSARTIVWTHDPEAFGRGKPETDPDADGSTTNVRLRFPGQYHDGESGLYYNWNRYYDPRTGRYVTSDPIGLEGGMNTYTYVSGNPLRGIDPSGLTGVVPVPPQLMMSPVPGAPTTRYGFNRDGTLSDHVRLPDWSSGRPALTREQLRELLSQGIDTKDLPWPSGLPRPIDPWKDTKTEARVPTNTLPPESGNFCRAQLTKDLKQCDSVCANVAIKISCKILAYTQFAICTGKAPKWPGDGGSPGGNDGSGPIWTGG